MQRGDERLTDKPAVAAGPAVLQLAPDSHRRGTGRGKGWGEPKAAPPSAPASIPAAAVPEAQLAACVPHEEPFSAMQDTHIVVTVPLALPS